MTLLTRTFTEVLVSGLLASSSFSPPSDHRIAITEWTITEQLGRRWDGQWITRLLSVPPGTRDKRMLAVLDENGREVRSDFGVAESNPDGSIAKALVMVRAGLDAGQTRRFRIVRRDPRAGFSAAVIPDFGPQYHERRIDYDFAQVHCLSGSQSFDPPVAVEDVGPPIRSVEANKPSSSSSRVHFHLKGLPPLRSVKAVGLPRISLIDWHEAKYEFADGSEYVCRYGVIPDEPVVVVHEDFRKLDAGELVLELSDPAGLTHGHGRGRLAPPGTGELTDGYLIDFSNEWTGRIQPFYAWWKDYGLWWAAYRPDGGYVGILPLKPSEWANPAPNVIRVSTGPGARIRAVLPFHRGTRTWAIVLSLAEAALHKKPTGANLMMLQAVRLGQNPLDKVKDMVLTWPGMDTIEYPHLLCRPVDIPTIRDKARTHPLFKRVLENHPDAPEDPVGLYLATGNEHVARRAINELMTQLRKWVDETLEGGNYGESLCAIPFTRPLRTLALSFDVLASSPSMTAAERDWCLRTFAFLAYCLYDEDRWPARNQGFHRGNVNFHSDDYTCRAAVVALLRGHPRQKEWMDYVEREMRLEFDKCVSPGGAWCEAPNYQGFTMHYLIIAMRLMQLNGFADFAGEPRFRETMDYFFRIQTPFDSRAGCHMLPTVGDTTSSYHSQSLQNVFAWTAALLREKDPAFAGRMMHAWKRGGSVLFGKHGLGFGQGWLQPLLLIDPDIPEVTPPAPLTSERLPGYGALLRNNCGTDHESYFLFKMGPIGQHFDSDEGSFHWYAFGRPISLDFGCMYRPSIEQPWLHSTLDFDRRRIWDQGEISQFVLLPDADFCRGEILVKSLQRVPDLPEAPLPSGVDGDIQWNRYQIPWRREILFVKGPDYVVIRDDVGADASRLSTGWTVQVLASSAEAIGPRAHCKGQYGVDMAVLVAEPPGAQLTTSRWGYESEPAPAWVAPDPMPAVAETQIALHVTAAPDADYLAALVPHKQEEPPPKQASPEPGVLTIEYSAGRDLVFFHPEARRRTIDAVTFDGRIAVVRKGEQVTMAHILDGRFIENAEFSVRCEGPLTLRLAGDRISGVTDGPARTCTIDCPAIRGKVPHAMIDGQDAPVDAQENGALSLRIPPGRHELSLSAGRSR
ncbi:MAG: hypothetical protein ACUVXJ_11970 [Phycisphaerae bacterium]